MSEFPRFAAIVGAPRCGTTSLAAFLQEHPDVCFSRVKEPHFFSQRDLRGCSTEELREVVETEYLPRFFPHSSTGASLLAEGSISYLYAPEQMEPILRAWPDARFIIAVRDPLDMLPSVHRRLLYTGDETVADFERAWALTGARAAGQNIPRSCIDPRWLQYEEVARLGYYVERFMQVVGRERCFVAVFDDLASDPAALYRQMLDFLDLAPHERNDFAPRRESRGYRLGWLQRLPQRPPVATRALLAGEKFRQRVQPLKRPKADPALVRAIFAARKRLLAWNRTPPPPPHLSTEMRLEISARFVDDVEHLSRVIGRDLNHWLDGALSRPAAWPGIRGPGAAVATAVDAEPMRIAS